ncbi:hypothetical protein [Thermococcus sp.]|uniref:hypothetical protein n=1 Tax=Thermococcus sp. TaxID=35749 RepID=UPI0026124E35|nr:hypothetical protein [Thermococcus sp.]
MSGSGKKLVAVVLVLLFFTITYAAVRVSCETEPVLQQAKEILKEVQEIRGLKFKEEPQIIVISRAEALAMWKPSKEDLETLRMMEHVYKMSLLIRPNYPFLQRKEEQRAGWMAATVGDRIYIIRENFLGNPDTARRALAHESVHVLQKQWFNAKYGAGTFDGTLAVRALVEGDADLVADIYCERNSIPIHKITSLSGDPVTDINIFPYVFGDSFVRYLYEKGGWKLVNGAYKRYPVSTAQIMHPQLYLTNVTPVNVSVQSPAGWNVLYDDRMGEFYVYILMRDHGVENDTAWRIASSWQGDRLILARKGEEYLLLWKVKFQNGSAARKFTEELQTLMRGNTYANYTVSLGGGFVTLKSERRG